MDTAHPPVGVDPTRRRLVGLRVEVLVSDGSEHLEEVPYVDGATARRHRQNTATGRVLEHRLRTEPVSFLYIPGFFGFREAPIATNTLMELASTPEMVLFDGHGIAHPRGFGAACQIGVALDVPVIGCAKSLYFGVLDRDVPECRFATANMIDPRTGVTIGIATRLVASIKPVFVSPGHKIDMASTFTVITKTAMGHRIPEPIRHAHLLATKHVTGG
nr:endonuclease V [Candidatus Sigynarchaeota archaeon]